jgi:thiamine biosynthesis lipoprotein
MKSSACSQAAHLQWRAMGEAEAVETFPCFGADATVIVMGRGPAGDAATAAALARRRLEAWHAQFSRFLPQSELSRLNADVRPTVPVSRVMSRLIGAILDAARSSGGLVDGTLVGELERAGYAATFEGAAVPLADALALAPPRAPAGPNPNARWREVMLDPAEGTVTRPAGLLFDGGGIAKGLFGDILAGVLALHQRFAVVCAGDVRFGGAAGVARPVRVASPFDDSNLHTFELAGGAAATSGIGRRSWLDGAGRPAHHVLDPATGRPAYTGVVQVTALAPSGIEAEVLAKTALLSGARSAAAALRYGGVVVFDDGSFEIR